MARLRLCAQHRMGIRVAVETGIGLGVFAGDAIGLGDCVRRLSAQALKEVLEEDAALFGGIELVAVALPIFHPGAKDNYHHFHDVFAATPTTTSPAATTTCYRGHIPVALLDQDMHAIAVAAAKRGFSVGELNPADSHGVVGEYWQNRAPGTEEKLALTTAGLLVQHHVFNPRVLDPSRYVALDVLPPRARAQQEQAETARRKFDHKRAARHARLQQKFAKKTPS